MQIGSGELFIHQQIREILKLAEASSKCVSKTMSQTDSDRNEKPARPSWTAGSMALLAIGLLMIVGSGLCSLSMISLWFSPFGLIVLSMGGPPVLIGAALVDTARYHHHTSSGRFGRSVLVVLGLLATVWGGLVVAKYMNYPELIPFGLLTAMQGGSASIILGFGLLAIGLRKRAGG